MTSTDSSSETVVLYRPVGQAELDLIEQSDYKGFPPRLPQQPIFYPVLTETYAEQIAREWNTADPVSGYVGYVTRFEVEKSYIDRFEVHQVGGPDNLEYWVPAEDLEEFNRHIVGRIEVVRTFVGEGTGDGTE